MSNGIVILSEDENIFDTAKRVKLTTNDSPIIPTEIEPLLDPVNERLSMFPIQYNDVWKLYEKQRAAFWQPGEIKLDTDLHHWRYKLSEDEKKFMKVILQFFAVGDGIVTKNIDENFGQEITILEFKTCYTFQSMMENIHNETYSTFIEALIDDPEEAKTLLNATKNHPIIDQKIKWVKQYMNRNIPFAERIIAFACLEGIFFSASFCTLFWFRQRGLMPGLAQANASINKDENSHTEFACLIYKYLNHKSDKLLDIVKSAVELECEFASSALQTDLIGMKLEQLQQHIRYVGDVLLGYFNHPPYYKVSCPFDWMISMTLQPITNFFDRRVSEYKRDDIQGVPEGGFKLDLNLI